MSTSRYILRVTEGTDKNEFADEIESSTTILSRYNVAPNGRSIMLELTPNEAALLESDPRVESLINIRDPSRDVGHAGYNPITQSKKFMVDFTDPIAPMSGEDGTEYAPFHVIPEIGITESFQFGTASLNAANGLPLGRLYISGNPNGVEERAVTDISTDIKQNFDGEGVDIVIMEPANLTGNLMSGLASHPNFIKPSDSSFKIVNMDWSVHDSSLTSDANNQITNTTYIHDHAVASAMAAAGTHTGWAKNSTVRIIYVDDGTQSAVAAVLAWHNNKGTNRATIINNSWLWLVSGSFNRYVPIDMVESFTWHDYAGNATIETKPGGGWGNDHTPFLNAGWPVWQVRDPSTTDYVWCIRTKYNETRQDTDLDEMWGYLDSAAPNGGIYHVWASGNSRDLYCGDSTSAVWNDAITISAGTGYSINYNTSTQIETLTGVSYSPSSWFIHRDAFNLPTSGIIVGGAVPTSKYGPQLSGDAAGGPMVDTFNQNTKSLNSVPQYGGPVNDTNGVVWNFYSGTSCAAPTTAGGIAILLEYWRSENGTWPTSQELKAFIREVNNSVDYNDCIVPPITHSGGTPYDPSNAPAASVDFDRAATLLDSNISGVADRDGVEFGNTSYQMFKANQPTPENFAFANYPPIEGNITNKHFALPWKYRMAPEFRARPVRSNTYTTRGTSGFTFPRRKISLA